MTNSEPSHSRARQIVDRLTELLDDGLMARRIDGPIDAAVEAFELNDDRGYSQQWFGRAAAGFLRHLYERASSLGRKLSPSQARDEVVALLEESYRGVCSDGYDGALLDAVDPSLPGLGPVLARLAESVKDRQRARYVQWVFARHLTGVDWATRCAMAAILVQRCRPWLPPVVLRCPPEQLADKVPQLVEKYMSIRSRLQQVPAHLSNLSNLFD